MRVQQAGVVIDMSWNPNQQAQGQQYPDPQQPPSGGTGGYGSYGSYGGGQSGPPPYTYGQQQQQQQYRYQPPASVSRASSAFDPTSFKMEAKNEALLSYLFWFFTGIFFFLFERKNRFVRFHAAQSTLLFGSLTLVYAVVKLIGLIPLLGTVILALPLTCASWVVLGIGGLLWIFLMLMAYRGAYIKLPVVGEYADGLVTRFTRKPRTP
jgi:uncharacterized membrane protein